MTEQQIAELLASDLQANFAWIQLGFATICIVLLIIAVSLAARAYAALSDARMQIYSSSAKQTDDSDWNRQSTPQNINAAQQRRKAASGRRKLP